MKIRMEKEELAEAVSWAARSLPTRPASPVLAGVRLSGEGDTVELSAFDLEISAKAQVSAVVDEPGITVVSGRLLAEIAKALPNQPVELGLEGSRVTVRCGRSSFGLPTLPVEDYPQLPDLPPNAGHIGAHDFAEAVMQVAIAASRDDTLPVLTGVRLEFNGDTMTLAATDRYRLAVRELPWQPTNPSINTHALVKARQLAELARTVGPADELQVALGEDDDGRIGFHVDGRELVTRLLHGEFPAYRKLLPAEAQIVATTETAGLIEAVKRVKLVAAERTTPIRLAFSDGEVLLRAGAFDDAQASESLESTIQGDPIEIAFNPDYLLDGLNALGAEQVTMSFTTATKPAVVTAAGSADYRYLLMPVRLGG
jgi:DNA polymerase III subunit beta